MRTYPGLKFVILIVVGLCAAMVLRAFAANKHQNAGLFRLEVKHRITLKCGENCEEKIKPYLQNSPSYDVCVREKQNGHDHHWNVHQDNLPPCTDSYRPGSPHIQQRAEFTTAKDLKAAVDALAGAVKSVPATSPSPAPHIQQQVESNTPKAGKAIAEALVR
jgi:hypothetical protein